MKFTIINISNKMPSWIETACDEYLKRINHGKYSCKIIELKSDKKINRTKLENMEQEANKIHQAIPNGAYIIILDEKGKDLNSNEFAHHIDTTSINYSQICFIIGGADGIHPNLKSKGNMLLRLSSFTYPHALVRVVILEQIYRAISIINNHPYHRE